MTTIGVLLGLYVINFVSTYAIKCHIVNKNINDFYGIAKAKGIPDGLRDYMIAELDKKPDWYDYIPVVNVILAFKDWINRKKDMELLEGDIKHFENAYGPIEQLLRDTSDKQVTAERKFREYYVGYFLESRPVVIYFSYNGYDDIAVSGESAKTYDELDEQAKMDTLMYILYQIYIGSKEYISCPWIDEVFTDMMVDSLVQTFEGNIKSYDLDEEKNKDLTRKKPK